MFMGIFFISLNYTNRKLNDYENNFRIALLALVTVSCKEETKEKLDEAKYAVGTNSSN
jgi:hypothetical protein